MVRGLQFRIRGEELRRRIAERIEAQEAQVTALDERIRRRDGDLPFDVRVEDGLSTIGLTPPENARVIHIHDTLHLENVLVSEAYASEIASQPRLEMVTRPQPMAFDTEGFLVPLS